MEENAFVYLDSRFIVTQSVQHLTIRAFAAEHGLNIWFYGAEQVGFEERHYQLEFFISKIIHVNIIFFYIDQFRNTEGLNTKILRESIEGGWKIHFAVQNIYGLKNNQLDELRLLSYSGNDFIWLKQLTNKN